MKNFPMPRRVRTAKPSRFPGLVLIIAVFGMLVWAQADDQAASERDRATLRQLAREAAGLGCELSADQATPKPAAGGQP